MAMFVYRSVGCVILLSRFFAVVTSSMDSMSLWDSDFDLYCYSCFCWQNLNMAYYCNQKTLMWTIISCTTGHFWVDEYLFPQVGYVIGSLEDSHERWEFLAWAQRMSTPSLPSSKSFFGTFTNFARWDFNAIFRRPWSSDICFGFFSGRWNNIDTLYWHVYIHR